MQMGRNCVDDRKAGQTAKEKENEKMDRPYTICHMVSSLNGKIAGPFMETEQESCLKDGSSVEFALKDVKIVKGDGVWLTYLAKNFLHQRQ